MADQMHLIQIKLDDGTLAVFESSLPLEGQNELDGQQELVSGGGNNTIPEATQPLKALVEKIQPVAHLVINSLKELNTPQEINLEFGIKLGGKTGIVFASAETECNFKIGLKWTNPESTG